MGNDAAFDLCSDPVGACLIPAFRKDLGVLVDEGDRCLMWSVAGAGREEHVPRHVGCGSDVARQVRDGLVGEVFGDVVAGCVVAGSGDVGVVADQLGGVLVGFRVEESVEAVKAATERPAVERASRTGFGEWRAVPLTDHVAAVSVRPEHFGERRGVGGDLAAVSGVAAVEVGEAAHTNVVMVASGV